MADNNSNSDNSQSNQTQLTQPTQPTPRESIVIPNVPSQQRETIERSLNTDPLIKK
jgi:sulfite reductase beta subunit-like hemoprotein